MCKAIASWHVSMGSDRYLRVDSFLFLYSDIILVCQHIRSEDLHNDICQVLKGFKQVPLPPSSPSRITRTHACTSLDRCTAHADSKFFLEEALLTFWGHSIFNSYYDFVSKELCLQFHNYGNLPSFFYRIKKFLVSHSQNFQPLTLRR